MVRWQSSLAQPCGAAGSKSAGLINPPICHGPCQAECSLACGLLGIAVSLKPSACKRVGLCDAAVAIREMSGVKSRCTYC